MSKWTLILISLLSAIIGGVIVSLSFIVFASNSNLFQADDSIVNDIGAGHKMLSEYHCPFGTTKEILLNGVDDNFALGNPEPSRRSERLAHLLGHPANFPNKRDYDELGKDKVFIDYFELPLNVYRGLFVTRILPSDDYGLDYITIGDLSDMGPSLKKHHQSTFRIWLNNFERATKWNRTPSGIYSVRLEDINFQSNIPKVDEIFIRDFDGLIPYLKAQNEKPIVEVMITDDTAVDFMGMAVCVEPTERKGLTYTELKTADYPKNEFLVLTCDQELTERVCNPEYGDTLCTEARPVACYQDNDRPSPKLSADITQYEKEKIQKHWIGGDLKFTPAIRGDSFKTLSDVNQYCNQSFGAGWRVLSYHDGGTKAVVTPRSASGPEGRVWLDIKDQPRGTCWARDTSRETVQSAEK